jgi:anti-sigma B factor antagonist
VHAFAGDRLARRPRTPDPCHQVGSLVFSDVAAGRCHPDNSMTPEWPVSRNGASAIVSMPRQLIVSNRLVLTHTVPDRVAGHPHVVLDFTSCDYIDSSGIGALVRATRLMEERGQIVVLAGLNDDLRTLFDLTRIDTLFVMLDSSDSELPALLEERRSLLTAVNAISKVLKNAQLRSAIQAIDAFRVAARRYEEKAQLEIARIATPLESDPGSERK